MPLPFNIHTAFKVSTNVKIIGTTNDTITIDVAEMPDHCIGIIVPLPDTPFAGHAEGIANVVTGVGAHAEGAGTLATNPFAHAEGCSSSASGGSSHAEGRDTRATAECAHAEGRDTRATAECAHAEGRDTRATAECAHAEGRDTIAYGEASHTQNTGTIAAGDNQTAIGRYNEINTTKLFVIGNGTSNEDRRNALTVDTSGTVDAAGGYTSNGVILMGTTTIYLQPENWSDKYLLADCRGVMSNSDVIITPTNNSETAYVIAGIRCVAQDADKLTFNCINTPTVIIGVDVTILYTQQIAQPI